MGRLHRAELPSQVEARLQAVEQALFTHGRSEGPGLLAEVIAALGRCHESVAHSGSARHAVRAPLLMRNGLAVLEELRQAAAKDVELQIAIMLAAARDRPPTLPLRALLSPVTSALTPAGFPAWTNRPAFAPLSTGLAAALAQVARRRGFPGAVEERVTDLEPAVQGSASASSRVRWSLPRR